jgi:hypothetical protein
MTWLETLERTIETLDRKEIESDFQDVENFLQRYLFQLQEKQRILERIEVLKELKEKL